MVNRRWLRWNRAFSLIVAVALALALALALAPVSAAPVAVSSLDGVAVHRAAHAALPVDVGFPSIDPEYLYTQWSTIVQTYQAREAAYDNAQSSPTTGHDGFATYWQAEMLRNLNGFGATAVRDTFTVAGWSGRPATSAAFNIEVSVPGVAHPEQVVVIGCHYDGEADSTQSANDDGSGCAIELAVAKALGVYWKAHNLYPDRTLRFVIYDAEEQGVFGSFHYVNQTINGDLNNVVAMLNEEQSGIGYPLRYLGKASNPLLPTTIFETPLSDNESYNDTSAFTPTQIHNIQTFRQVEQGAPAAVFAAFRSLGYTSLTYRNDKNQPISQQIFTQSDLSNVTPKDDTIGSSDQYAFALDGLPTATYIGNFSYYDNNPPPWSYPYDQPQDTVQLMNIFASGSQAPAEALKLSLALPGMLTTWTLAQPAILGFSAAPTGPTAAIGDIGSTMPNQEVNLAAQGGYDPGLPNASLSYIWNFDDGSTATTPTVSHAWAAAGTYTLTLTVTDSAGSRTITKTINVTSTPVNISNPYAQFPQNGIPPANPQVRLPTASSSGGGTGGGPSRGGTTGGIAIPSWAWQALTGLVVVLALGAIGLGIWLKRPASPETTNGGMPSSDAIAPASDDTAARKRRENALQDLLTPHDEP